jgi:predicted 2-oxoglutarate/Fe(II)-dependent dioxygenase YbiX
MKSYTTTQNVLTLEYLANLQGEILASPYFTTNNLNRDFVNTKGFSVVFRRSHIEQVITRFPFFKQYIHLALKPHCNAFYLNPLQLKSGSRVDPHIDRSLRSYCKTIEPPETVSVLYVNIPPDLSGGELILSDHRKHQIGKINPQNNMLVHFQGHLTHAVNAVKSEGLRLSVVCEQYCLREELLEIPEFTVESRITKKATIAKV